MNFKLSRKAFLLLKLIIWVFYGFFLIKSWLTIGKTDLKVAVVLCGLLIELTLISFLNHWFKFKNPFLLDWFRLATFFTIVLNFFIMIPELDQNEKILVDNVVMVNSSQALIALLVILAGLVSLKISELLLISQKKNKFENRTANGLKMYTVQFRQLKTFYIITFIIGIIQVYMVRSGIVGYRVNTGHTTAFYSFIIQTIGILGPFILAIYAIIVYKYHFKDRIFYTFYIIYFLLQIFIGFLSGMKEEIISPIIIVLIPFLLGGNKVPKNVLVTVAIFVIFLYPINNNYRDILNARNDLDRFNSIELAISKTFDNGLVANFLSGTESYQNRLSNFPLLMYSIENEEKWQHHKYLNRYVYLPFAWIIPRFLIENKPVSDIGGRLYMMTAGRDTSSITPSTYGWAFFEGGFIPLAISFLTFGIFISYIEIKLNKKSLLGLILYISVIVSLLKVESDIYFTISGILQSFLIGYFIYNLTFKSKVKQKLKYPFIVK